MARHGTYGYGNGSAIARRQQYRSEAPHNASTQEADANKGPWPELRIVRKASIDAAHSEEWTAFLNRIGRLNYGAGDAKSLGSVAITLVSATDMSRMLGDRYDCFQTRSKAQDLVRRYAKHFNQFVDRQIAVERQAQDFDRVRSEIIEGMPANQEWVELEEMYSCQDVGMYQPKSLKWDMSGHAVRQFDKFGSKKFGIDLSHDPELEGQFEDVLSYLRDEGLNTNKIDRAWRPHATLYSSYANIGQVAVRMPDEHPTSMYFDSPHAVHNNTRIPS